VEGLAGFFRAAVLCSRASFINTPENMQVSTPPNTRTTLSTPTPHAKHHTQAQVVPSI
jgi:hypothetical protein